jgi:DUF971 family protein
VGRPVEIVHDKKRNQLTISWDDQSVSELPVPYLRSWCPCAGCQGHGGVVRCRPVGGMTAEEVYEMGAYAICVRFSDGHDTGIYTWEWLRRIAPGSPPQGLKRGVYARGAFHDEVAWDRGEVQDLPPSGARS